jgi:tetratricopeptide (TPR) repeat protein
MISSSLNDTNGERLRAIFAAFEDGCYYLLPSRFGLQHFVKQQGSRPMSMNETLVHRPFRRLGLAACMTFALMSALNTPRYARADEPEEAVKVFQQLRPSVVSIDNSEGSGTGILLDNTGLILTCAHVVTSPMPYEVKVDLGTADEPRIVVFKKVQILGYHPERDLALIKIDPKEQNATLIPADISKTKASSGQRIYAIGDPGVSGENTVLTKTITQGIISGVDREFYQQKFYQIDAAINPGNSGGPVVDHNGKVLGLVQFIFTNMQATNFVVPLLDVDVTKFVPLTEHKADPKRSEELVKYAKQFQDLAQEALRQEGKESDSYKRYFFYAAYCYSEALIYDPGNPDIYTAIGTQDITMEMYDTASAYLVRAIELRPWGVNNAAAYHELGVSWSKQKIDDKAIAAWKEGLAKFPYSAALWDDQAVYALDKDDYETAAYSSSVALACGARKSRITTLQKMLRDSRANMDEGQLAELAKKLDHDTLCDTLDKLRQKSNKARKRRSLYMTTAFVDVMKEVGTLDVPGVEDKISQVPLRAPENLAVGEDVADNDTDPSDTPPKKKHKVAIDDGTDDDTDTTPHKKKIAVDDGGDDGTDAIPHKKIAQGDDGTDDDVVPPAPHKKRKVISEDDDGSSEKSKEIARGSDSKSGGDDWIGTKKGATTKPSDSIAPGKEVTPTVSNIIAPTPAVTGIDLSGDTQTVDDAKMVQMDVDKEEIVDAVFSADGSNCFVLQKDGLLRKVAIPSLKEERQTNLSSACVGMGMTRRGLAVYVNSAQEIWLIDPATLEVKHRVALPGVVRIATSIGSGNLLVSTGPKDLELVDPVTEKIVAKYSSDEISSASGQTVNFGLFTFSPDGKEMFCTGSESICEFSLKDGEMTFVAAGPKIGVDPQAIIVSPDSHYVAMPCKSGNFTLPGETKADFSTYVFKISDLQKPVMTIASGLSPRLLAFDFPARQIYAQNDQKQLIVYSPTGDKIKDYVFNKDKDATAQKFLVHPSGRSLMILTGGKLDWVTLP